MIPRLKLTYLKFLVLPFIGRLLAIRRRFFPGVLKSVLQAYNRVYSEDTPWGIEFTLRDEGCSFTISIRKNKDNHLVADAGEVESDKIGDALSNFGISPTAHKEMDYLNESVDGCGKFDIEINKTDSGTVEITM